jgi:predicted PurR-regulated permease PerM
MTIDSYILLAIFMSLTVSLILIIQKIEQFNQKLDGLSELMKNSNNQIKNSTTQINDEIRLSLKLRLRVTLRCMR